MTDTPATLTPDEIVIGDKVQCWHPKRKQHRVGTVVAKPRKKPGVLVVRFGVEGKRGSLIEILAAKVTAVYRLEA